MDKKQRNLHLPDSQRPIGQWESIGIESQVRYLGVNPLWWPYPECVQWRQNRNAWHMWAELGGRQVGYQGLSLGKSIWIHWKVVGKLR